MMKFTTKPADMKLIKLISDRAWNVGTIRDLYRTKLDVMMDISATHANGCRLRLEAMLDGKDFDFLHDVLGIRLHLDRETGQLSDHFMPRYAA